MAFSGSWRFSVKKISALLFVAALLAACSGDGKGTDASKDMEFGDVSEKVDYAVSTYDELPVCTAKREGATAFAYDAGKAYICKDNDWADNDSLTNLIYNSASMDSGKSEHKSASSKNGSEPDDSGESAAKSSSSKQYVNVRELIWDMPKESFFNPNIEYGTMTDERDGKVYKTVKIGDQVWMAENLNYDDSVAMPSLKGKMLDCGDKVGNCALAGRMYGWTAAIDSLALAHNMENPQYCGACCLPPRVQGVCPDGWHLPNFEEWQILSTTTRNSGNLKSNSGWINGDNCILDSCKSTDAYGFSAVPFGYKEDSSFAGNGTMYVLGGFGYRAVFQVADVDGYGSGYTGIDDGWETLLYQKYRRLGGEIYASVRCLKDDGPAPKAEESRLNPDVAYDSLIDERDGQVYKTVKIGAQVWMAENLNYDDGKSKCVNDDAENCKVLGRLYTWDAAYSGCPNGWHLPDSSEWNDLFMDASGVIGYRTRESLKSRSGWSPRDIGTNTTGFSAMTSVFWSATEDKWGEAYRADIDRGIGVVPQDKALEYYVRCVKNGAIAEAKANPINLDVVYDSMTDDRDGKVYKTVKIGEQTWMAENLNYDDSVATPNLNGRSWCYDNESENCGSRGRLYTWFAAIDSVEVKYLSVAVQGICPSGWHLPQPQEWETLYASVGGYSVAGWFLKSVIGWGEEGNGSDAYGFSAFPAGQFASIGKTFDKKDSLVRFWSSEKRTDDRNAVCMTFDAGDKAILDYQPLLDAYSVRCIKDSPAE